MNILVLGGSGFVSGTMARHGLAAGHRVWGLSRGNKPLPEGVEPIVADRKDRAGFAAAIERHSGQWDLVIDCIGFNADDARQDIAVFRGRTARGVFISTDMACSPIDRPWRIDERYDRFETAPYGANKRAAEQIFLDAGAGSLPWTIVRPCHIYGPGSKLGCLPLHGRDPKLIEHLRAGRALRLVGAGHFLQQPIFVEDLARFVYSAGSCSRAAGEIYFAAGPDVVESRVYYRIIADKLGVELKIEEASIQEYVRENPQQASFCCHRVYAMDKSRAHGLAVPVTPLVEGLSRHLASLC